MNLNNIKEKLTKIKNSISSNVKLPRLGKPDQGDLTKIELIEMWLTSFIWAAVFIVLIAVAIFLGYWIFSRSHPKVFTGINYYRSPISVEIEGEVYKLEPFEIYTHQTQSVGDISISVKDSSNKVIETRNHATTNLSGVALDFFAPAGGIDLCIVELDVTEFFYPLNSKPNREVYLASELKQEPTRSYYYQYSVLSDTVGLLSLNNYDGKHLPSEVLESQKILGIYIVECDKVNDQDALTAEARWWTFYNPQKQQELYQKEVEEIDSTPEYQI